MAKATRNWKTWLPVIGWVALAVLLSQALLHHFFMNASMLAYHIAAGVFQGILIIVPAGLYVLWRHTTERERKALEDLREAEELREDLTAMLVHDLKNPVISSTMALNLVLKRADHSLDPTEREMLHRAGRSLERVENMIGDVLSIATAQAGRMELETESADICDIALDAVEENAERADSQAIKLAVGECNSAVATVDRKHIRRVLDNLIANAIAHTPSEGRIDISVQASSDEILVSVTDTGDGIDQDTAERLFDRYVRAGSDEGRERTSVGLGLAYCKLAVEEHGGRIRAENVEGAGTRFSFTLPL